MYRDRVTQSVLVRLLGLLFAALPLLLAPIGPTSAQIAKTENEQSAVAQMPAAERSAILADVVRRAWEGRACSDAETSLETTSDDGAGGWLVRCKEGQDYWLLLPAKRDKAAVVQPCILARAAGTDCYANLRTMEPADIGICADGTGSLDRRIRSCSTLIQSGRFDHRRDGMAILYMSRAVAFGSYNQLDLAIADFDTAVRLDPGNLNTRYNRAVALERSGKTDDALLDIEKVVLARPADVNALYQRGYLLAKKGEHARAIADFDAVLRLAPNHEQASRRRDAAIKARAGRDLPPPLNVPAQTASSSPKTPESEAAYCLEVSFGYAQQNAKLLTLLQQNRDKARSMLAGQSLSASERKQVAAGMASLEAKIVATEAASKKWSGTVQTVLRYLQNKGLLGPGKDMGAFTAMSEQARADQIAVQDIYRSCLRGCAADDPACKNACDEKANRSEPSKRMLRCDQIATSFR